MSVRFMLFGFFEIGVATTQGGITIARQQRLLANDRWGL
jgi:hypothetical protein